MTGTAHLHRWHAAAKHTPHWMVDQLRRRRECREAYAPQVGHCISWRPWSVRAAKAWLRYAILAAIASHSAAGRHRRSQERYVCTGTAGQQAVLRCNRQRMAPEASLPGGMRRAPRQERHALVGPSRVHRVVSTAAGRAHREQAMEQARSRAIEQCVCRNRVRPGKERGTARKRKGCVCMDTVTNTEKETGRWELGAPKAHAPLADHAFSTCTVQPGSPAPPPGE